MHPGLWGEPAFCSSLTHILAVDILRAYARPGMDRGSARVCPSIWHRVVEGPYQRSQPAALSDLRRTPSWPWNERRAPARVTQGQVGTRSEARINGVRTLSREELLGVVRAVSKGGGATHGSIAMQDSHFVGEGGCNSCFSTLYADRRAANDLAVK